MDFQFSLVVECVILCLVGFQVTSNKLREEDMRVSKDSLDDGQWNSSCTVLGVVEVCGEVMTAFIDCLRHLHVTPGINEKVRSE